MDELPAKALKELLEKVLYSSEFAWWDWHIPSNRVACNSQKVTMLGYSPDDFRDAGYEGFASLLHPDDLERAKQALCDHLEGRAPIYQVEYRIRRADGEYTWHMDRGMTIERLPDGRPARLRGIVVDLGGELSLETKEKTVVSAVLNMLRRIKASGQRITACVVCQRIKTGETAWQRVGAQFAKAFPLALSHGICPDCMRDLYPEETQIA